MEDPDRINIEREGWSMMIHDVGLYRNFIQVLIDNNWIPAHKHQAKALLDDGKEAVRYAERYFTPEVINPKGENNGTNKCCHCVCKR